MFDVWTCDVAHLVTTKIDSRQYYLDIYLVHFVLLLLLEIV